MMAQGEKRFIPTAEASELFNIPVYTLRKWVREGKVPAYRAGRSFLFDPKELDTCIRKQKIKDSTAIN